MPFIGIMLAICSCSFVPCFLSFPLFDRSFSSRLSACDLVDVMTWPLDKMQSWLFSNGPVDVAIEVLDRMQLASSIHARRPLVSEP